jgi:uncharacterized protein (DUF169 family)
MPKTFEAGYYDVLKKLELKSSPMAVKYTFFRPEGIEQLGLESKRSFCEMFRYAQTTESAFYFNNKNTETCVGKFLLGMEEMAPFAESGQIGPRLGVFDDARANQYFYQFVPRLEKATTNYVTFAPVSKVNFRPDVLVFSGTPEKLEPVLRAVTYSTGELYKSICTPVMGCSWFLIYPFKTGNVNFIVPTFVHGLHGRELFDSDEVIVSIPYQWIPTVIESLDEMPLHLEGHKCKEKYYSEFEGILGGLAERAKNP